jgi:hypothetical protein
VTLKIIEIEEKFYLLSIKTTTLQVAKIFTQFNKQKGKGS